jgi:hypothetical protein
MVRFCGCSVFNVLSGNFLIVEESQQQTAFDAGSKNGFVLPAVVFF